MDKSEYLKKFKRENPVMDLFSKKSEDVGKQLVQLIKKEGITYDEAYASLQYAYNKLKFESNFVKIQ
ncbi:hypothetical protein [Limosilactobacillus portuensis]|uniref:hypothetical protein n=1 Tax=Limosilactobacillus portuensis TaxID=2742601 RepID=UPI003D74BA45